MTNKHKWDQYYIDGGSPPWESLEPFVPLKNFFLDEITLHDMQHCVEFGCGCSANAVYLAKLGFRCKGIDISEYALARAKDKLVDANLVEWIQCDIFDMNFHSITGIESNSIDFLLDMQCFHILRNIDESRLTSLAYDILSSGGIAMIVAGAASPDEAPLVPGPPVLSREEVISPYQMVGFSLVSIELTRFNPTIYYSSKREHPPLAWVAIFRK